tara:strand:- start:1834 stop:3018 length:1185 start_codon:yes stop_codon:yes gene_type:complete
VIQKWNKTFIPVTHSIDGQAIELKKFQFDSGLKGPHLYLQSGVHGAELQGNLVIQELIRQLPDLLQRGIVTCIPCANPIGLNHKIGEFTAGRYHPVSRENWNRNYLELPSKDTTDLWNWESILPMMQKNDWVQIFRNYCIETLRQKLEIEKDQYALSLSKKLAWILQLEALHSDFMLDLHTGPLSIPYLYAADFSAFKSIDLGFDYTIVIPAEFGGAMDEACFMPWVHLQDRLAERGQEIEIPVESYTLELGNQEKVCTSSAINTLKSIFHFMMKREMVTKEALQEWSDSVPFLQLCEDRFEYSWANTLDEFVSYRAPESGLIEYLVNPGSCVETGQAIMEIHRPTECLERRTKVVEAVKPGVVINICQSAAVTEGMRLMDILQTPYQLTAEQD